jgi:hypothetical protein
MSLSVVFALLWALAACVTLKAVSATSETVYVSANGTDAPGNGASEANPLRTIQYALNSTSASDVVVCGFVDGAVTIARGVALRARPGTLSGIDCQFAQTTGILVQTTSAVVVTSIIVRNCQQSPGASGNGGGVIVVQGSPEFAECDFTACRASSYGGAVYVLGGAPRFTNCSFTANVAERGAALWLANGNASLDNVTISWNNATTPFSYAAGGAGIYVESGRTPSRAL